MCLHAGRFGLGEQQSVVSKVNVGSETFPSLRGAVADRPTRFEPPLGRWPMRLQLLRGGRPDKAERANHNA